MLISSDKIKTVTLFLFLLFPMACQSAEEQEVAEAAGPVNERLAAIRSRYQPPACFYVAFDIEARDAVKQTSQNAQGSLRVDNKHKRMRFIFTEPVLGVTLSRITVSENMVYLNIPHADGVTKQKIPLKKFELSGLGYNNITLPFKVFRDLLFASLPPELFTGTSRKEIDGENRLVATLPTETGLLNYIFTGERLTDFEFKPGGKKERIVGRLDGQYKETIFPQKIVTSLKKESVKEELELKFNKVRLRANCHESFFPLR